MKEKLLKNWGLKIMAVLMAVLIWFLVANVEDYTVSKTITGIPVEILNEEAITKQDMVYEIVQGKTVDIKIEGRRSVVEQLTAEDFSASADLSELSITNSVQISVDAVSSAVRKEITIAVVDNTMKVAIEERGEQKLPVSVVTTGQTQEGYAVVSAAATPNMVTITGAASRVKDIKTVRVEVDVEGLNTSITTRGDLVLLDGDGEAIETEKLTMSLSSVSVKVSIQKTKEIPVQVVLAGEVAEGYAVAGDIEYQPTTVLIAGEEADLRTIDAIVIDDIDAAGRSANFETTVDIANYLPEGIVIADQTQEVAIKVNIEKLVEKTFTIKASDIRFVDGSGEYEYQVSEDDTYELTVTGLKKDLDDLTVNDLSPTIDASRLGGEGAYSAVITFQELEGIQYSEEPLSAMVTVTKKDAGTEKSSGGTDTEETTEKKGSTEQ